MLSPSFAHSGRQVDQSDWQLLAAHLGNTEGHDSEEAKHARKIPGALGERMVDASDDVGITPHDSR